MKLPSSIVDKPAPSCECFERSNAGLVLSVVLALKCFRSSRTLWDETLSVEAQGNCESEEVKDEDSGKPQGHSLMFPKYVRGTSKPRRAGTPPRPLVIRGNNII